MADQAPLVEIREPAPTYRPATRGLMGVLGALLGLGGLGVMLSGEIMEGLSVLGFGGLFIYALVTGRDPTVDDQELRVLHPCPCCGAPILDARLESQACLVCGWEVGDAADNQGYSLEEARANVARFGTAYRPGDEARWGGSPPGTDEREARNELTSVLEAISSADGSEAARLWRQLDRLQRKLRQ